MKKNLNILAVIFSVVLNVVFIGSYFYYSSRPLAVTGRQANHDRLLYEELNLDRDQLDRLKSFRDNFHAFVDEQGQRIKAKQLELVGLLAQEKPDRRAIAAKQEEIQGLQRQMQAGVIDHLLQESRIFTPEQRQQFFALMKERIDSSVAPRPRWMPRTPASPAQGKRP